MLNYVGQFFKIRVVFHTLYLWNEVRDPQFFCISATSNSLSDCSEILKKISTGKFSRTSLKRIYVLFYLWFHKKTQQYNNAATSKQHKAKDLSKNTHSKKWNVFIDYFFTSVKNIDVIFNPIKSKCSRFIILITWIKWLKPFNTLIYMILCWCYLCSRVSFTCSLAFLPARIIPNSNFISMHVRAHSSRRCTKLHSNLLTLTAYFEKDSVSAYRTKCCW